MKRDYEDGKKIETASVKEDHRKSYRVFLILFLISFSINLILLASYLKRSIPWKPLLKERKEARDGQKGEGPEGGVPTAVVHLKHQAYLLLCEKNSKALHLFHSEPNRLTFIKSYPCIVGSNNGDKKKAGDLATPEGVYFLISFLSGLPEKYGTGAFSLNYPNLLDQKEGKKGYGIWLHGSPDHMERPLSSEGCVVVKDEDLKELMRLIKIGETPLVIVDTLQYQSLENQRNVFQNLMRFLEDWKRAWESLDTGEYLSYYSRDFLNSEGLNYERFKAHKERVNRSKRFIKLHIESKSFLVSRKNVGQIAVLRIDQDYISDNFKSHTRKILYLREEQRQWKIIGDVALGS
jgi:murein L,D-transpeptidase YafK